MNFGAVSSTTASVTVFFPLFFCRLMTGGSDGAFEAAFCAGRESPPPFLGAMASAAVFCCVCIQVAPLDHPVPPRAGEAIDWSSTSSSSSYRDIFAVL